MSVYVFVNHAYKKSGGMRARVERREVRGFACRPLVFVVESVLSVVLSLRSRRMSALDSEEPHPPRLFTTSCPISCDLFLLARQRFGDVAPPFFRAPERNEGIVFAGIRDHLFESAFIRLFPFLFVSFFSQLK